MFIEIGVGLCVVIFDYGFWNYYDFCLLVFVYVNWLWLVVGLYLLGIVVDVVWNDNVIDLVIDVKFERGDLFWGWGVFVYFYGNVFVVFFNVLV